MAETWRPLDPLIHFHVAPESFSASASRVGEGSGVRHPRFKLFQLHGGADILISHLATVGQFAKSRQDDHWLRQSWQCDVADVYLCANLVGEWYSMPLCQSPACLCTFHSMCSFALLSNLCMVGWGVASPRGADVICYEIQNDTRCYQMLWDAIRCYMMM